LRFADGHRVGRAEGKAGSALSVFGDCGNWVREDDAAVGQADDDGVVLAIYYSCPLAINNAGPPVAVLCDDHLHVAIYVEAVGC